MVWEVVWSKKAVKQLKKLDKKDARIIRDRVLEIREDPYKTANRLVNQALFSLRVGQYRVILDLKREKLIIFTVSVGKRGKIYDHL